MTRKEFIAQFVIHNGFRMANGTTYCANDQAIAVAKSFADALEKEDEDFFSPFDEYELLKSATEDALDAAQRDGGFAIQLNKTQHEDIVQAVSL